MSGMRPAWTEAVRGRHLYTLIGLLAILPYLNSLRAGFTFDDPQLICDNPMINRDPPLRLFSTVYQPGALYRPLTMLTYAGNARLHEGPLGYHVVNVVLHAAVSLAVFALADILLRSAAGATATASLFAVHPIHTEAVSGIVGRAELLAALFVLSALLAAARAARVAGAGTGRWQALSVVAFACGILSKESAFMALPLVGLVHWWVCPIKVTPRRLLSVLSPHTAVALGYLGLRIAVVGSLALPTPPPFPDNPLAHVSWLPRVQTALVVLTEYFSQLALPVHLSADYSFNAIPVVTSKADPRFLLAVALLTALTMGLSVAVRRFPFLLIAACFTVIPLALTANLLFPIGTIKAERLLYLPSFGWCLACGWLAAQAARRRHLWWMAVLALVIAGYGARTWTRNRDWRDNFTLFSAAVEASPNSTKAHYNLGVAYDKSGNWDEAMVHLRQALVIQPDSADAAFAIGAIYERKGLDAGALHWYAKAMQFDWRFAKAHLNTGVIRYRRAEYASAEAAFRTGLESEPQNPRLLIGLALALLAQERLLEAQTALDRVDRDAINDMEVLDHLADARRALRATKF